MNASYALLLDKISQNLILFLIFEARLSSTLAVIFFLRREWVPGKIMVAFSMILGLYLLCSMNRLPVMAIEGSFMLIIAIANQCLLGVLTALIINFLAEFFIGFGQMISMQAGLAFVNFYVPKVGSITPLTQFFMLMCITIFFELNGHLIVIQMIIDSIVAFPLMPNVLDIQLFAKVLNFSGILFKGIAMLSLSVIFAVMLSNITLAVLTKFSPQLNLFSIGINISLIVCIFIIYISFDLIAENGTILFNELLVFVRQLK